MLTVHVVILRFLLESSLIVLACFTFSVSASTDDVVVLKAFTAEPEKKWGHILRWYRHIVALGGASANFPAPVAVASAAPAEKAAEKPAEKPAAKAAAPAAAAEDDDVDLFGEETEEEKAANEARKAAAEATKKPAGPVGRSCVILDVKPWGEETDMKELEAQVRSIAQEGLEWKAGQLIPLAFGIKKLQIMCHIGTFLEIRLNPFDDLGGLRRP